MTDRRNSTRLGRTQILVLRLLAEDVKSARTLGGDWPGLTESAARSAAKRLEARGLVDVTGWDEHDSHTYGLTPRGREVEAALNEDDA